MILVFTSVNVEICIDEQFCFAKEILFCVYFLKF